jgi:hypothetical protein
MVNTEKAIAKNPKVDRGSLDKALRAMAKLRASGVPGKGYGLARPFAGRKGTGLPRWHQRRTK